MAGGGGGGIFGGFISGGLAAAIYGKAHDRRTEQARWRREKRLDGYVEMLSAAKEWYLALSSLFDRLPAMVADGRETHVDTDDQRLLADGHTQLRQTHRSALFAAQKGALLRPNQIGDAAGEVTTAQEFIFKSVKELAGLVDARAAWSKSEWAPAQEWGQAIEEFVSQSRDSLAADAVSTRPWRLWRQVAAKCLIPP